MVELLFPNSECRLHYILMIYEELLIFYIY
jgi:hypothetical protein